MDIDIERLKTDAAYWDDVAPEGATHYWPELKCWYRVESGVFVFDRLAKNNWSRCMPDKIEEPGILPRPTKPAAPEWDGKGLPPVGCECEYDRSVNSWTPAKCIAIGHDRHEPHAVIQTTNRLYLVDDVARLRPLRTKEQRQRDELAVEIWAANGGTKDNAFTVADRILSRYNLEPKP